MHRRFPSRPELAWPFFLRYGFVFSSQRVPQVAGKSTWMDRSARYVQEAQSPFYVLHHMPIILTGYYVVQWNANALVKFLAICLPSYLATFVLYDIGVGRTAVTRFLFGVRPRKQR